MKRIIFLLLLLASSASAQVNIFVPNGGRIISEEELKTYVNSWLLRVINPNPGTDPPVDPDTTLQNCLASPAITGITNISKTGIRVTSSGAGITSINWYVYDITAPGLYLRSGNTQYLTALTFSWATELPPGHYGVKLEAVNCKGSSALDFVIPNTPTTPTCSSGPSIDAITSYSRTGMTFSWSGLNVPEIVWKISQSGNTLRTGSFVVTASQSVTISYAAIPYGTYDFQLTGLTCPTTQPSKQFTLTEPVVSTSGRHVYMNFTGYGFTNDDPTGMTPEHRERAEKFLNLNYQGVNFKGIDGIRVNMKWYEYEPTEGSFRDDKVVAMINWCVARGIRLSVALIPWRREGDGMFDEHNKARLANGVKWSIEGDLPSTYRTYMPSMNSVTGYAKFKAAAKHLSSIMANYPNTVDYISTATSDGEEYQMVRESGTFIVSGYAGIDVERWAGYSGGLPVQKPAAYTEDAYNSLMSTSSGRKWYEYQTDALKNFHAAFVQGVREGAKNGWPRAAGMYAGIGAPTAVWDNTYKLNTIYSAGQADQPSVIYSSEGDAGALNNKLMATDMNLGTFPGADPSIEFDPDDLNTAQIRNPPWEADLSSTILYNYSASFYKRGGKIVHFAMAFNPDKIPQLAEGLYKIKTEFLDSSSGMTGITTGTPIVFTISRYTGLQEYRFGWSDSGGGLTKQIKITLQ